MAECEGVVDIYNCVKTLCSRRVNMIQTEVRTRPVPEPSPPFRALPRSLELEQHISRASSALPSPAISNVGGLGGGGWLLGLSKLHLSGQASQVAGGEMRGESGVCVLTRPGTLDCPSTLR